MRPDSVRRLRLRHECALVPPRRASVAGCRSNCSGGSVRLPPDAATPPCLQRHRYGSARTGLALQRLPRARSFRCRFRLSLRRRALTGFRAPELRVVRQPQQPPPLPRAERARRRPGRPPGRPRRRRWPIRSDGRGTTARMSGTADGCGRRVRSTRGRPERSGSRPRPARSGRGTRMRAITVSKAGASPAWPAVTVKARGRARPSADRIGRHQRLDPVPRRISDH